MPGGECETHCQCKVGDYCFQDVDGTGEIVILFSSFMSKVKTVINACPAILDYQKGIVKDVHSVFVLEFRSHVKAAILLRIQ